ncbi:MAG: AAA family ATPase [Polyangiaceae bacterium]|nr:AAA family ATPase [Polyangiaceae bacterium]
MLPGYRLLDPIAVGPRSIVTRAIREADSTLVVVKTARRPEDAERLRQEFAVTRGLPGIRTVRPIALESGPDGPVLISQDVGGESLVSCIHNRLSLPNLLNFALQMVDAVAEVHGVRLVHKDIKPSNFCLDAKRRSVFLTDFSIAERLPEGEDDLPRAAAMGGTLAYISPEQTGRTEQLVDYRTDYYSLGVTLYELLSGRLPFDSPDPLEIVHGHIAKDPPPLPPEVPESVDAIVRKLLAKSPDERYQSASGLRRDLTACLDSLDQNGHCAALTVGQYDVPERFRIPLRVYGRDKEIQTLLAAFERITQPSASSSLVLVAGYSGIGKSSLIHELRRPIAKARGRFASGKFDQVRRDIPYTTLAQALDELALQLLGDSDAHFDMLRKSLRTALGPSARVIVDLSPRFGTLLGSPPPIAELPPAEARARLHAALGRFFATIAPAEHPLVLFFDDLQWADPASLRVLHSVLTQRDVGHVLVVGAYRDNEVNPTHPLMLTLADMENEGTRIERISLTGLPEQNLEELVQDIFYVDGDRARGLAHLVHEKTHGNPFFAIRFLRDLHRDGLIVFDSAAATWRWDLGVIRERKYADNVVELLTGHIERLPSHAQYALEIAACIGNAVTTRDLAVASHRTEEQISGDLAAAVRDHLVLRVAEGYEFSHDRVQQAAYERIAEDERPRTHRALGRAILADTPPAALDARIFDIVSQLGRGLTAMNDVAERRQLADLELRAAQRARRSCAFRTASQCLSIGIEALGPSGWDDAPGTMRELCILKAECDFLSSEFSEAEKLCKELMKRVPEGPDKADVYRTLIGIYTSMGRPADAASAGLEALRKFGIELSPSPTPDEVAQRLQSVIAKLETCPLETLADLESMTDPNKRAAMSILLEIAPPTLFTHKGLYATVVVTMVDMTLRGGVTDESAAAFGYLGALLVDRTAGQYRLGWLAGKFGWDLMERRNLPAFRAKLGLMFGDIVNAYGRHYRDNRRYLFEGLHAGQENGDLIFSCYTCNHLLTNMLVCGDPLDEVWRESERLGDFVERARDQNIVDIVVTQKRLVASLRGTTVRVGSFDGPDFDEAAFEQRIATSQMGLVVCWYYIRKAEARVFGGQFDEAVAAAEIADRMLSTFTSEAELAEHLFFYAIAAAMTWERALDSIRPARRKALLTSQQQFEAWAEYCPDNFACRRDLLSAELARIDGRIFHAEKLYESAIAAARSARFPHVEALAAELAAQFYRQRGLTTPAAAYLRAARDAYARWGATGKVRALEQAFPELRALEGPSAEHRATTTPATSTANRTLHTTLDIAAVLRATRSISEEIVLDKLVSTVLRVLLADAGAERGHFILLQHGDPVLVASGRSDADETPRMTNIPLENCDDILPSSLARLVLRAGEAAIVNDALIDARFAADRYVVRHRPRALACVPIANHGKLLGLLLLEHRRLPSVFSKERLELIRILAAQAAVSIDNALLYRELDRRVRQRTQELEEAQRRLVDTAHRAGMAEIATNVLHNVGNALNSVSVSADVVLARLQDSRIGTIERVARLVSEHKNDLPAFFSSDPRAQSVPDLLDALAKRLEEERRSNLEDLGRVYKHVGHIRDIVSLQQSVAGATRLFDDVMISELVEDAIRISALEAKTNDIEITRDIHSSVTSWPLEKHRVLQILVNLISNAGHALLATSDDHEKSLIVSARVENGDRLGFTVRDTGCGIAPDVMPRLFTFGFTTRAGGHGFGLHSCAIAARSMGGEIIAQSDGVGRGATFTLLLPPKDMRRQ